MKIFAIGATGVLGTDLVPRLLAADHEVTVMAPDRLTALPAGVRRIRGGLLDTDTPLSPLLAGHDAVVNLATRMPRSPSVPAAWEENTRIRSQGTVRLAHALREAGIPRLVQMSITMAYADGGESWLAEDAPFDEDPARAAIVRPVAELESTVRALDPDRVGWTVLRGARFVGPGTLQGQQLRKIAEGTLGMPSEERSFVSLVHVSDFARAVLAVLERNPAGRVFNIADQPVRVGDYLTSLAESIGREPPERDASTPGEPSHRVDSRAAREELGWTPMRGIIPVQ